MNPLQSLNVKMQASLVDNWSAGSHDMPNVNGSALRISV
jgi:hypothetical protein